MLFGANHFGASWILKGVKKSSFFFCIDSNKIRKNGILDRVFKKHEFHWTFDAKIQGPDRVKNEFGRRNVAIYKVG